MLSDLRVIEVSAYVAAPLAGATLASLGADVIRVEQLGGGIDAGRWPVHDGRSLFRAGLDRGKRSVTVDLRSERGQDLVAQLVAAPGEGAGILVTNLDASGWMAYERLAEQRPDLIMVAIEGTPDGEVAVDYTVNAGLGFPWITGPEGARGPVNHVLPAWDVATGLLATTAVLVAERARRAGEGGTLVKIALSDVALVVARHLGLLDEALLEPKPRGRFGNALFGSFGRDFETRDGRPVIVLALTPRQWRALAAATALGDAFHTVESTHGVDLRDEGARFVHRDTLFRLVADWVAERTLDEVAAVFAEHGVLWGPYRTFKELLAEDARAATPPGSPLRFGGATIPARADAPAIGADTRGVLSELLELGTDQLEQLERSGTIAPADG